MISIIEITKQICLNYSVVSERKETHMDTLFMTADEVAKEMNVSKAYAYKIIQRLNRELQELGYLTVSGKVNRKYFMKKVNYNDGKERQ